MKILKKKILIIIILLAFININAQISVSAGNTGKIEKFKPEVLKKFKSTTTIFILSDVFNKEQYDEILKKSWTVTPYLIISSDDFDYQKYLNGKFSFAVLSAYTVNKKTTFYLHSSINLFVFDMEVIDKEIVKVKTNAKDKNRDEKVNDLLAKNIINIAKIELFSNTDMLKLADKDYKSHRSMMTSDWSNPNSIFFRNVTTFNIAKNKNSLNEYEKTIMNFTFKQKTFKNYSLGMLKNYFQKLNDLLTKEENYWMYETDYTKEVKNLRTKILYIPDYNKVKYKPGKIEDENRSDKDLKELFEDFNYKYEFITENDLNTKILNSEEIYYLRYVKVNNQKIINIVNSKTGEVIYRDYEAGFGTYNIDGKDFKKLAKIIND